MNKRQITGLLLTILPFPTLLVSFVGFAITSFVFQSAGFDPLWFQIISICLSTLGVLALLGIIIGMPVGIYLLASRGKYDSEGNERVFVYKNIEKLTKTLEVLLIVGVFSGSVYILLNFANLIDPNDNFVILSILNSLVALVSLAFYIVMLMWFYKTLKNAHALKIQDLGFQPEWAIVGNIIPLVNYVAPYLILRKLWKTAVPDVETDSKKWSERKGWNAVDYIYILNIVFGVIGVLLGILYAVENFDLIVAGGTTGILPPNYMLISIIISIITTVYGIKIIRIITESHARYNNRISIHNE